MATSSNVIEFDCYDYSAALARLFDDADLDYHNPAADEEKEQRSSTTVKPHEDAKESSKSWISQDPFNKLLKKATDAKGAASKPVIYFIKQFFGGTKLVFVTGQTGTGKSTILSELTGLDVSIGTRNYQICPAIIKGEQYLFIDTGGFGASDLDDTENFEDILQCLNALGPFVTVAVLLLVVGSPPSRFREDDIKIIRWVQCFCGPSFFRNITFVTSKWDDWSRKSFQEAWRRLETELLLHDDVSRLLHPPGRYHGGVDYHHGFPGGRGSAASYALLLDRDDDKAARGDELRRMIHTRYGGPKNSKPATLQVVREMNSGIPQLETEAAKVLRANVVDTVICIRDDRAVVSRPEHRPLLPLDLPPPPRSSSNQDDNSNRRNGESAFWRWLEIARRAAAFYKEARERQYESSNQTGIKPLWELAKDWFLGWWANGSNSKPEAGG
ncbi:hypothetical protein AYL99_02877 [Fonsecaea erecta]|uniref:G domain-containing protein n=1 Tax=Fonsecaea erecta TaxID=1367422 RepID=A0A178ZV51_9EURO|nr:hypothetical protein AYL99_02877 [Fonsecaea erecta]OAP63650.1 hypothetical protein AYL99_02877 [Fonsecaea erecta]